MKRPLRERVIIELNGSRPIVDAVVELCEKYAAEQTNGHYTQEDLDGILIANLLTRHDADTLVDAVKAAAAS